MSKVYDDLVYWPCKFCYRKDKINISIQSFIADDSSVKLKFDVMCERCKNGIGGVAETEEKIKQLWNWAND